jgi:glycosyltransferase involved in cell wall biosynthesis
VEVIVTGLPLDWTAAGSEGVFAAACEVALLARDVGADIVHLNSPALAAAAAFDGPIVGVCHSCLATWWAAVRSGPLPADFAWRTEILARAYRAASALVAPTRAFARLTADAYGIPEPRVVPNGRHRADVVESGAPLDLVFTAGRLWDEGKNLAALDRAAARLDAPFVAAGPLHGPNGAAIALANIRTLGPLDERVLRRWLARRPIFASVPRYEPFGLAVLEAAQAGCALVLSDIPTLRELWDAAALFVDAGDDAAIAHAIALLLRNPARRAELAAAAQRRAGRYTVEAMTEGMLAIYEAVLAKSAVRRREFVA